MHQPTCSSPAGGLWEIEELQCQTSQRCNCHTGSIKWDAAVVINAEFLWSSYAGGWETGLHSWNPVEGIFAESACRRESAQNGTLMFIYEFSKS